MHQHNYRKVLVYHHLFILKINPSLSLNQLMKISSLLMYRLMKLQQVYYHNIMLLCMQYQIGKFLHRLHHVLKFNINKQVI